VVVDTDNHAVITGPAAPTEGCTGLNRQALLLRFREHGLAIGLVLPFKEVPARHADDTRINLIALQLFGCRHTQSYFGSGTDEDDFGSAVGLVKDVRAF